MMMRTSSAFRLPIVPWLVLGAGCADVEPPPASWVGRPATELVERIIEHGNIAGEECDYLKNKLGM